MDTNPYAPPKAQVADPEPNTHGLKRRSVIVMVVFTIFTFGLYYLAWWFRRRPGLNRLDSPAKLPLWPLLLMLALYVSEFFVGLTLDAGAYDQVVRERVGVVSLIFQLFVGIVMLVMSFRVKDMIEDHAEPDLDSGPMFVERVKLSGLMTFFFSIYYLQWAINRHVVGAR
jgi:hypothetical protein